MAKRDKKEKERPRPIFFRPHPEDYVELERRRAMTGAPLGTQVRILVHEALKRKVIR